MENNKTREVKIFPRDINTNQKKSEPGGSVIEPGGSLLKKNEFTMILIAALVVTALVFFFFFRGSSKPQAVEQAPEPVPTNETDQVVQGFEDRISALEVSLAKLASSSIQNKKQVPSRAVSALDARITRIEKEVNLTLATLVERVDKFEGRLNKLAVVASTPPVKSGVKPKVRAKKPAVAAQTPSAPEKKVEQPKKTGQFHTVQKGETLWSISQKYKTTVAAICKLNNLTPEDQIYSGSKLLVK